MGKKSLLHWASYNNALSSPNPDSYVYERPPIMPERILWLEVIHRAVMDFRDYIKKGTPDDLTRLTFARSAKDWVLSAHTRDERCSFLWAAHAAFSEHEVDHRVNFIQQEFLSYQLPPPRWAERYRGYRVP